jgi:hypothetical protein
MRIPRLLRTECALRGYKSATGTGHALRTTGEPDHILKVLEIGGLAQMLHDEAPDGTP